MNGLLEAPSVSGCSVFGEFDSMPQAVAAMESYYSRWPSMGYGTSLAATERDGKVEVRGRRALHCD
jgi:hypothetical protein